MSSTSTTTESEGKIISGEAIEDSSVETETGAPQSEVASASASAAATAVAPDAPAASDASAIPAASDASAPDAPAASDASAPDEHEHEHPSDWQYIKIALILAVLTAIEVFTYFESVHRMSDAVLYVLLTVLMVLKFIYVVAWFMHLKFDSVLFKRIFVTGISLALGVYLIMLTAFRIWT